MEVRDKMSPLPTRELSAGDRATLFSTVHSDAYRVLLDIMHRFVVEQETELMNLHTADTRVITAQFHAAQMAWQMFTRMQHKVLDAAEQVTADRRESHSAIPAVPIRSNIDILGNE